MAVSFSQQPQPHLPGDRSGRAGVSQTLKKLVPSPSLEPLVFLPQFPPLRVCIEFLLEGVQGQS